MTSTSSSKLARGAAALALAAAVPLAADAASCESLKTLSLADTQIDASAPVAASTFKDQKTPWAQPAQVPEHCRVQGTIRPTPDSDIKFEVWLPSSGWNGKLQGVGNGGFAGSINYHGGLVEAVQRGYAAASTDTGHAAHNEDASWGKGHPEKLVDYGHRAIHLMTVNAKAIVRAYYGEAPKRAYFASCSNGGRQALMTAQRYPEDYDGIIAGAPANDWIGLMLSFIWNAQAALKPDAYIPAASSATIQAAVNEQCDSLDGVTDGVVSAAEACGFKAEKLLCAQGQTGSCLSTPQVATLQAIYQGLRVGGTQIAPGFTPGGEVGSIPGFGWDGWVFGPAAGGGTQGRLATNFMRSIIVGDDTWRPGSFDFERDAKMLIDKYGPILNATDPDLSRYAARGGKLIIFHGWADAAIQPLNSINYFGSVGAKMGAGKRAEFVRLFMAPGVQHCFAGPGPSSFGGNSAAVQPPDPSGDLSAALEQWVEKGVAPETVRAVKPKNLLVSLFDPKQGGVERTGLLCAYPKHAKWDGKGSADDAASYTCVETARE